jgi:hypothetical protein
LTQLAYADVPVVQANRGVQLVERQQTRFQIGQQEQLIPLEGQSRAIADRLQPLAAADRYLAAEEASINRSTQAVKDQQEPLRTAAGWDEVRWGYIKLAADEEERRLRLLSAEAQFTPPGQGMFLNPSTGNYEPLQVPVPQSMTPNLPGAAGVPGIGVYQQQPMTINLGDTNHGPINVVQGMSEADMTAIAVQKAEQSYQSTLTLLHRMAGGDRRQIPPPAGRP